MLLESLQSEATALGDRKLDTVPMCFWARKCRLVFRLQSQKSKRLSETLS